MYTKNVIFRNDDVSFDTDISNFTKLCAIFHAYGFTQLHGVTLFGKTQDTIIENDIPKIYPGMPAIDFIPHDTLRNLSNQFYVGDNKALIQHLNASLDDIAFHGLYHYSYADMTEEEQDADFKEGLLSLSLLFPKKKISYFIPPFNKYNEHTQKICSKYGLVLLAEQGIHLESLIHHKGQWELIPDTVYRYHHHRFYKGSLFTHYDLSLAILYRFFMHSAQNRPLMSIADYKLCLEQTEAQVWYGYAYEKFEELLQCYFPYQWIRDNVNRDKSVLETGCGAGGVLHMLWHEGFQYLHGRDYDPKAIDAARLISKQHGASMDFAILDCTKDLLDTSYDVILGMSWIYLLNDFSLKQFMDIYVPHLSAGGYLIFDVIDSSFTKNPKYAYCTHDWNKPENERSHSEYHEVLSEQEVLHLAESFKLRHVTTCTVEYTIPRKVYVFKTETNTDNVLL